MNTIAEEYQVLMIVVRGCNQSFSLDRNKIETGCQQIHPDSVTTLKKFKKNSKWTPELREDLKRIWLKTDPNKHGHKSRLAALWHDEHSERDRMSAEKLRKYGEFLFKTRHQIKEGKRKNSGIKRIGWSKKLNTALLEIWHDTHLNQKEGHTLRMHNAWQKRFPEYSHLLPGTLRNRVRNLLVGRVKSKDGFDLTKKNFGWTEEMNDKLMKFWFETEPGKQGHRKRIYDRWVEEFPKYSYLTVDNVYHQAKDVRRKRGLSRENKSAKNSKMKTTNLSPGSVDVDDETR